MPGTDGRDTISGGVGDDVYFWNKGDGTDFLTEADTRERGGTDVLRFGADIRFDDLRFEMNPHPGGDGADVFQFTRTSGNTQVTDFNPGEGDLLQFFNTGGAVFDADSITRTDTGMMVSVTDTATGQDQTLAINLMSNADPFTTSLDQLLGAVEVI